MLLIFHGQLMYHLQLCQSKDDTQFKQAHCFWDRHSLLGPQFRLCRRAPGFTCHSVIWGCHTVKELTITFRGAPGQVSYWQNWLALCSLESFLFILKGFFFANCYKSVQGKAVWKGYIWQLQALAAQRRLFLSLKQYTSFPPLPTPPPHNLLCSLHWFLASLKLILLVPTLSFATIWAAELRGSLDYCLEIRAEELGRILGLQTESRQIALPHFTYMASLYRTGAVLLTSLVGGSTRCLPVVEL